MSKTKVYLEKIAEDAGMTVPQYLAWASKFNAEEQEYLDAVAAMDSMDDPDNDGEKCPGCNAVMSGYGEGQIHRYACGSTTDVHGALSPSGWCRIRQERNNA